jgi:hypothetical protein
MNWSVPFVEDWDEAFPLWVQEDNPPWLRMLEFYRRASKRMADKMLGHLDLFRRLQEKDKAVHVRGSPEEIKLIHSRAAT